MVVGLETLGEDGLEVEEASEVSVARRLDVVGFWDVAVIVAFPWLGKVEMVVEYVEDGGLAAVVELVAVGTVVGSSVEFENVGAPVGTVVVEAELLIVDELDDGCGTWTVTVDALELIVEYAVAVTVDGGEVRDTTTVWVVSDDFVMGGSLSV